MSGRVVWVTGLSGAGKTTLCTALRASLHPQPNGLVTLDGDVVREAFGADLGYAEADRVCQIQRMQRLARMLANQGLTVLVAALYSNAELLAWNRAHLPGYLEVYLQASLPALARRDSKGLYAACGRGDMTDVVGVDIPFTPPARPDVLFDVDTLVDVDDMVATVLQQMNATLVEAAQ